MANIKPPKVVFLITCFLLFLLTFSFYLSRPKLPPSIPIQAQGQPTLGYAKARVHIVVFEEPKCSNCRNFQTQIFPSIKEKFIDTNKVLYTVIPVSFLPGSMTAANALLCVYYENVNYPNEELFFKYLDYIYQHEGGEDRDWATEETLVTFARSTSPAIKINILREGIAKEIYRLQVERNTDYGTQVMDGALVTPTVYVNGIKVHELTLENLQKLIEEVLKHEGVL